MTMIAAWGVVVGGAVRRYRDRLRDLQSAGVHDELTGLYDGGYFSERLREEMRRADRYGVGLALVLLDVDGFHVFRETYGHHKADLLLVRLSELLRLATRDTDIVARLADQSFGVILPLAPAPEAQDVADRICRRVAGSVFEGDEIEPAARATVSCGVAAFPEHGYDEEALLASTRDALSRAKEGGGARVVTASGPATVAPRGSSPGVAEVGS